MFGIFYKKVEGKFVRCAFESLKVGDLFFKASDRKLAVVISGMKFGGLCTPKSMANRGVKVRVVGTI